MVLGGILGVACSFTLSGGWCNIVSCGFAWCGFYVGCFGVLPRFVGLVVLGALICVCGVWLD